MTHPTDNSERAVLAALALDARADAGHAFVELVAKYLGETAGEQRAVSPGRDPAEVARRFEEALPAEGRPLDEVIARLAREVLPDSIALTHPMYLGHQVSAPLPAAVWSEMLVAALNQSVAVREMSPVATVIEHRLVRWMADLAGLGPDAGGTLTSGGTEATFTALAAARAAALPEAWTRGVGADPPVVLCGEHAHYAVTRAVGQLGLGVERAIAVPSRDYRMDPAALDARLADLAEAGVAVMAVVASAGSTPTGSFDDLAAIGGICARHGIWLHVDGAHGASALLSGTHRSRLRGIELARSIAWDPHKMMLLPLSAGVVLVRSRADLDAAFAQRAPYLFHGAGDAFDWDQGKRSFLCSRRADALKLWIALQRYGTSGIGALYDRLCGLAAALHERVEAHPRFAAVHRPESNILCFRYVGHGRGHGDGDGDSVSHGHSDGHDHGNGAVGSAPDAALDAVNRDLRERYNASGEGWITTTVLDGRRVLRVTVMNPATTEAHLDRLLEGLDQTAC